MKYREITPNNSEQPSNNYNVNSLIKLNEKLESKISLLYKMLSGDDSSLVRREKICEEKYNKALIFIAKLKRGKEDLLMVSRELYQRLDEADNEREKLLSHIQNLELQMRSLEYENMKLRRELSEAKQFIKKMLASTSENAVQSYKNYENPTNGNVDTLNMNTDKLNIKTEDLGSEEIKRSIAHLAIQVENMQTVLKRLTDPITSSLVPNANNPYSEIQHFLD